MALVAMESHGSKTELTDISGKREERLTHLTLSKVCSLLVFSQKNKTDFGRPHRIEVGILSPCLVQSHERGYRQRHVVTCCEEWSNSFTSRCTCCETEVDALTALVVCHSGGAAWVWHPRHAAPINPTPTAALIRETTVLAWQQGYSPLWPPAADLSHTALTKLWYCLHPNISYLSLTKQINRINNKKRSEGESDTERYKQRAEFISCLSFSVNAWD